MGSCLLSECVNDADADAVVGARKSAIRVSSAYRFCTFNAITSSCCAEWSFRRPIRPEMRTQGREGNFTRHRSDQSRREFSLGGVYAAIDEDAAVRAGRQAGRRHRAARERGCYHQLQGIELQWVCVCVTDVWRLPGLAGVDQCASLLKLLLADSDASLLLLRWYTSHLEQRKIKARHWHFEERHSLAVLLRELIEKNEHNS